MNTEKQTSSLRRLLPVVHYEHFVAGVAGGVTSTLALHPLDLIKIRLSVNDGRLPSRPQYRGIVNAAATIRRDEGFRGLYRGVVANCFSAGASWGLYFLFYNSIKSWMLDGSYHTTLGPWKHMTAAAEAGVLTLILTNPISMVKTRLCLQYANQYGRMDDSKRYDGVIDAFKKVYKYEGCRGFYKGLTPGIFNVSHGAFQFMIYEEMKEMYAEHTGIHKRLSTIEYIGFAAASKLIAASVTYPYQLFRARLQDQHQTYDGFIQVVLKTWQGEGIRGFYKGVTAYGLHVTPNICIVFVMYETLIPSAS